jgi:hypothetical protein
VTIHNFPGISPHSSTRVVGGVDVDMEYVGRPSDKARGLFKI